MELKELQNYKKQTDITLSASKINLFFECPRKYFFRYLLIWDKEKYNIQPASWPGSGFGEAIHAVLEFISINILVKEPKIILQEIDGKFKEYYDRWLNNNRETFRENRGYSYKKFIEKGEKYALMFSKFFIAYFNDFKDLKPEHEFKIKYDYSKYDITLNGIVDLIYFFENGYKIIDFKTTKESNKFYFTDWVVDTQSLIYFYYCLKTFKSFPSSFSYLVLNHEDKTLFFKEQYIDKVKKQEKFFQGLTYQVDEVYEFTKEPDLKLCNSSQKQCLWCEYKEVCELKYKVNLSKMLSKIRK